MDRFELETNHLKNLKKTHKYCYVPATTTFMYIPLVFIRWCHNIKSLV